MKSAVISSSLGRGADEVVLWRGAVGPLETGTETGRRRITRGGNGGKLGDISGVFGDVLIGDEAWDHEEMGRGLGVVFLRDGCVNASSGGMPFARR